MRTAPDGRVERDALTDGPLSGGTEVAVHDSTRHADVNAAIGAYLRDLAFAQPSQQQMFGYKRAAAVVLAGDACPTPQSDGTCSGFDRIMSGVRRSQEAAS